MVLSTIKFTLALLMTSSAFLVTSLGDTMKFIIKDPPRSLTPEPLLLTVNEGDNVRLNCPVHSQPQAFVNWLKDGAKVNLGWLRYRMSGINLRIKNVDVADGGWFTCVAVNGFGSVEVKIHLLVVPGKKSSGRSRATTMKTTHSRNRVTQQKSSYDTLATRPTPMKGRGEETTIGHNTKRINNSILVAVESEGTNPLQFGRGTHENSWNPESQNIYSMIAIGLIVFSVVACLIFLLVLAHFTCGLRSCWGRTTNSHLSPPRPGQSHLTHSKTLIEDDGNVSSSVSSLLISSSSSLERRSHHKIGKCMTTATWSLIDAASLAEKNEETKNLKF